jgi:hypothetical protein
VPAQATPVFGGAAGRDLEAIAVRAAEIAATQIEPNDMGDVIGGPFGGVGG